MIRLPAFARGDQAFIAGTWQPTTGQEFYEVDNPATEEVLGMVKAADLSDLSRAVQAARSALPPWSATSLSERASYLSAIASFLRSRREDIAQLATLEVGTPITQSRRLQADLPALAFEMAAGRVKQLAAQSRLGNSVVERVPLGVVGCISPWNYPLYLLATKVAGALAAGCTVVAKPSELAPFTALVLGEAAEAAFLPPGVLNVVTGGPSLGAALASHPDLDAISFTGSTEVGRIVAELAARTPARVSLELGGKGASLVLAGADLKAAVTATVDKCFQNAGQTCAALSRLIVPQELLGSALTLATESAARYVPADPLLEETMLGPVASQAQRHRVRTLIEDGIAAGATVVTGGASPPSSPAKGYFVEPTVLTNVDSGMTIANQEIFGPVLSVLSYRSDSEAIEIANQPGYGLAAAVWAASAEHAIEVARSLRAGSIGINGGPTNPEAPFGGFRLSGYGRERGSWGIEEFTTSVAYHLPEATDPEWLPT